MKTKDLIEKIQECKTAEQFLELQNLCPGYDVGFIFETKQAYVKKDIRRLIKNKLAEEDLPAHQLSKAIGFEYNNLISYLSGKRGIPPEVLEKIFGILQL